MQTTIIIIVAILLYACTFLLGQHIERAKRERLEADADHFFSQELKSWNRHTDKALLMHMSIVRQRNAEYANVIKLLKYIEDMGLLQGFFNKHPEVDRDRYKTGIYK